MNKSKLESFNLHNKRVFLRADLNIPTKNGKILNDFKLFQILKTINFIKKKGGKIILATHIDRPKQYDPNLSTKILIDWFRNKNYKIDFEQDLDKAYKKSLENFDQILLLENLRFFKGEQNQDINFAKQLSKLADFYINDAFGVSHRNDTSVTLLAQEFPKDNRSIGILIEKELNAFDKIINPEKPFLIILGGSKIEDKINLLFKLINKIDAVLLCPAIVFSFLKAENKEIGKSLVDDNVIDLCKKIIKKAQELNIKLIYPIDYQVAQNNFEGQLSIIDEQDFKKNDYGISIGPKTAQLFNQEIKKAKTIFFNGIPGDLNRTETLQGTKSILNSIANSKAYTLVGGGDSVASVFILGYSNKITHLSTGGGSTLAYLNNETLPGLKYL